MLSVNIYTQKVDWITFIFWGQLVESRKNNRQLLTQIPVHYDELKRMGYVNTVFE